MYFGTKGGRTPDSALISTSRSTPRLARPGSPLERPCEAGAPRRQRVSFYAFGAGLALLLEQDAPAWKAKYLTTKFLIEKYLE